MKSIGLLDELIVDNFAGGGGASTGIEQATGRPVDISINHDPDAIAMHKANHPYTQHYCESVWDIDPRKATGGRPVGLAWFSPDCKHFSKAKGGKPVNKNIRGLAWVAVRWAATVRPRVIILENVEEFKTWGPVIAMRDKETGRLLKKVFRDDDSDVLYDTVVADPDEIVPPELQIIIPDIKQKGRTFNSFVNALRRHGYAVEWRELRACDYGAPTIRKRFFLIARCDGAPIRWPEPTHGDPKSTAVKEGKLKPWRTAAEIIDWSIPCPSIFERDRPLAENTLRRIARGLKKFVLDNPDPYIVKVNHAGDGFRGQAVDEPLQTVTAKHGYGVVTPYISRIGQTGFGGDRMSYSAEDPLTTVTSKAEHLLVSPYLAGVGGRAGQSQERGMDTPIATITSKADVALIAPTLIQVGYGEAPGQAPRVPGLDKPIGTITAGGNKFALVSAYMAKHYGGGYTGSGNAPQDPVSTITTADHNAIVTSHLVKMKGTNCGQPTDEPLQTITAGGLHFGEVRAFLLKYYGTGDGQSAKEPLGTVTTRDRFGLVTVAGEQYQIADIGMRMLEPHELYAAQGFPPDYKINFDVNGKKYSKAAQVARCGNSVPPPFAEALVRANLPEMAYRTQLGTMRQLEAAIND